MSSGGGPRATGSGLSNEGKFRQRVDDHYRDMAAAKKSIKTAGNLHIASALGLGTVTGVMATLQDDFSAMATCAVCAVLMVVTGLTARAASPAAGTKDVEKHALAYASWVRTLTMLLLLVGSGVATTIHTGAQLPPTPIGEAAAAVGVFDLIACAIAQVATAKLLTAFEAQKAKAKKL